MAKAIGSDPFAAEEESITQSIIKGPRKRQGRRLPHRMTYYLPKGLCEDIKEIAEEVEVPISDVAHYALRDFVDKYREGEIELEPQVKTVRRKLV